MAEIRRVTDRAAIRNFVEPLAGKFLFELADLDDAAWPHSQYYAIESPQHALILTGNYRLVIERLGKDKIRVLSVEDYHGD